MPQELVVQYKETLQRETDIAVEHFRMSSHSCQSYMTDMLQASRSRAF